MSSNDKEKTMPSDVINHQPTGLAAKHKVSSAVFDIDKYGFAHHDGQVYERLSDKVGQIIKSSLDYDTSPSQIQETVKETPSTKDPVPDTSDETKNLGTILFNTIVKEAVAASAASGAAVKPLDPAIKSSITNVAVKAPGNTVVGRLGQLDNNFRFPGKVAEGLASTGQLVYDAIPTHLPLADRSNGTPSKYGVLNLMSLRHHGQISKDKVAAVHDFNQEFEKQKHDIIAYDIGKETVYKENVSGKPVNNKRKIMEQAVDGKEGVVFQDKTVDATLPQPGNKDEENSPATGQAVTSPVEPVIKKEIINIQSKINAEIPKPSVETAVTNVTKGELKPNMYVAGSLTRPANVGDKCQVCGAFDHQIDDCFWAKKRR